MIDVAWVDVAGGGVFVQGEVLAVKFHRDCGAAFGGVDGEALRAVSAVDGGGGGEDGGHGECVRRR